MPEVYELDLPMCDRLLRLGAFGRVGLVTSRGPEIIPVNYAVQEDSVVVRVESDGLLARNADGADVVFEVDAVDHEYWRGFSVVARGVGEVVDGLPDQAGPLPRPWPSGRRELILRITWVELTGRSVGRPTELESLMPVRRVLA